MSSEENQTTVTLEQETEDEDEDSEPVSYETRLVERQEETSEVEEHIEGLPNVASEAEGPEPPEELEEKSDVSINNPEWLSDNETSFGGGGGVTPTPQPRGDVGELIDALEDANLGDIGTGEVDLGDVESSIDDITDIDSILGDLNLSNITAANAALIRLLSALVNVQAQNVKFNAQGSQLLVQIKDLMAVTSQLQLATSEGVSEIVDLLNPPTTITVSGTNVITTSNSPQPVVPQSNNTDVATRELLIRASSDNTDSIAIGDDKVSPTSGYILKRGESMVLDVDLRTQAYWMSSTTTGQEVQLLGVV